MTNKQYANQLELIAESRKCEIEHSYASLIAGAAALRGSECTSEDCDTRTTLNAKRINGFPFCDKHYFETVLDNAKYRLIMSHPLGLSHCETGDTEHEQ